MRTHLGLFVVVTAVCRLRVVQSQNDPFGLTATSGTRSVASIQELADAWADPTIRTAQVQGSLTIETASWKSLFVGTGGIATLAQGSYGKRKNFTIAGALPCSGADQCHSSSLKSVASINFQRMPDIFMVGSGSVLQFQNIELHNIAHINDYQYSPEQPYRTAVIGAFVWPSIALAPKAELRMIDVSVAYRNDDPVMTCEQRASLAIHSLRQLPGNNQMILRNSTAGWTPGESNRRFKIVNGSDDRLLGEATVYTHNFTMVCRPSEDDQRLFGKLTAPQSAAAISVPIGVAIAVLLLALCIRHYSSRKAITSDDSSLVLKDVESGLRQHYKDESRGSIHSKCWHKQLSCSSMADSEIGRVQSCSSTDKAHSNADAQLAELVAQSKHVQQVEQNATANSLLQQPVNDTIQMSAAATEAAVAADDAPAVQEMGCVIEDSAHEEGMAGSVLDKQAGPVQSKESQLPSTTGSASAAGISSRSGSQSSVRTSVCPSRGCSHDLHNSSQEQNQQQRLGSVTPSTSECGPPSSSGIKSRRLSSEDLRMNRATPNATDGSDTATTALLKARSDIAVLQDLKIGQLLATGSYGRVYKGRWKSVTVAVKVMEHHSTACSITSSNAGKLVMAGRETTVASSLAHPNVVQTYHISTMTASQRRAIAKTRMAKDSSKKHRKRSYGRLQPGFGTLTDADDDHKSDVDADDGQDSVADVKELRDSLETWLIMEFCEMGSLEKVVKSRALLYKGGKPDMIAIYKALLDAAAGLDYLHSMGVVHGDLKTANVLLKGSTRDVCGFACKITDFGLSRVLDHNATHVSTRTYGTITYMPKEVLLTGQVSYTMDVYSFGLMMWELYAGCSVYEDDMSIGQLFYMIAYSDWRPEIPSDWPPGYSDLIRSCWHQDPEQRPIAQQLLRTLQKLFAEAKKAATTAVAAATTAREPSQSAPLPVLLTRVQQQHEGEQEQQGRTPAGFSPAHLTKAPCLPARSQSQKDAKKSDCRDVCLKANNLPSGSSTAELRRPATVDTAAVAAAVTAAAAAAVAAVLQQGSMGQTAAADSSCISTSQGQTAVMHLWRPSLQQKHQLHLHDKQVKGSGTTADATRPLDMIGSSVQQGCSKDQQVDQHQSLHPNDNAATTASAGTTAVCSTVSSANTSEQGQGTPHSEQQQQQGHGQQQILYRQLCAGYQMASNSIEMQPRLHNEPVSSESLFPDGLQSTDTIWHDCNSGADITKGLMLPDGQTHYAAQVQLQDLVFGASSCSIAGHQQQVAELQEQQLTFQSLESGVLPNSRFWKPRKKPRRHCRATTLAAHNYLEALEMANRQDDGAD